VLYVTDLLAGDASAGKRPAALAPSAVQLCQVVERLRAALDRTSDGCAPKATNGGGIVVANELIRRASAGVMRQQRRSTVTITNPKGDFDA